MQKTKVRRRAFNYDQIKLMVFKNKNSIKIPRNVKVYYDAEKNIVLIKSFANKNIISLGTKLVHLVDPITKQVVLYVSALSFNEQSSSMNTNKILQSIGLSCIKQALSDISTNSCKKLKLFGVGYKASLIKQSEATILHLKLGYSHSIYFKLPARLTIEVTKNNTLFLSGNSAEEVSSTAAAIRNLKTPEPYKGKGILYVDEKIQLKVGKKV